jgi:hypothetical protein
MFRKVAKIEVWPMKMEILCIYYNKNDQILRKSHLCLPTKRVAR